MAKDVWRYRERERDGSISQDHIRAESLDDVMAQLRIREVDVVAVERLEDIEPTAGTDQPGHQPPPARAQAFEPTSDRPPPAPRPVPPGTTGKAGGFVLVIVGALFTGVASLFIVIGIVILLAGERSGLLFVLFPMIHFTIGVSLLVSAVRGKSTRRNLIANGAVATATIDETGLQSNVRINGRSPYKIEYDFEVDGKSYSGKRSTMNRRITKHRVGDRIWVLYDAADPSRNLEWPPL